MRRMCFIVGPTASGKSALAAEVARQLDSEVLNADAYQVYRGLETLTAAPDIIELASAPHRLFSFVAPTEEWDAHRHLQHALPLLSDQTAPPAIITGGSGLYIKFLSHGPSKLPQADPTIRAELDQLDLSGLVAKLTQLDPKAAANTDPQNRRYLTRNIEICLLSGRPVSEVNQSDWIPNLRSGAIGFYLDWDREILKERIARRTAEMLQAGAIEELSKNATLSSTAEKAIGVKQIRSHLRGEISLDECAELISIATRQYAKRQRTWFRRESSWLTPLEINPDSKVEDLAKTIINELTK